VLIRSLTAAPTKENPIGSNKKIKEEQLGGKAE
jgi:hypothetical protein